MTERALLDQATGPYRVQLREVDTDVLIDLVVAPFTDSWPIKIELPPHLYGRYAVTAYLDREANDIMDDCPFPSMVIAPEQADLFDNIQAQVTVFIPAPAPIELNLERRICGPGSLSTGISGQIDGLQFPLEAPVKLLAQRLGSDSQEVQIPLRTSIWPYVDPVSSQIQFSVGEFLPGTYDLTFFLDNDDNNSPTPCSAVYGGADRAVARIENIDIKPGVRNELMVPVDLTKADCPEQLSGIAGTIEIGASLDPALLGSTTPTKLLEGALWVRLVPSTGEGDVINVPVVETIIGRPLPLRYTVTGVDPGLWHVTAYLDRDEDTNFSPCNIVSGGLDAVSGRVESVRARLDEIIESDRILLNLLECGQNELSAVRGQMAVHQEEGPVGSGRPVILEVKRTGEPSEPQYVTLFENHTYIEGSGGTFIKQLSPGQYSGKFFVDTTRDSIYTECLETRFGDRYLSESFEFELGSDNITDLGQFVLSPNACPPFEQPIRLEIIPDESLQMLPPRQLSIRVRESGGWSETTRLGDWEEDDGAWIPEFRPLPPGQYQFTVYTDEDENGEYSPCPDRGGDRFTAEFALEVRADRGPPAARFPLTDGCPQ